MGIAHRFVCKENDHGETCILLRRMTRLVLVNELRFHSMLELGWDCFIYFHGLGATVVCFVY